MYDQDRAKDVSGSGPIKQPEKPLPKGPKPLHVTDEDDEIVRKAALLDEQERKQAQKRQTRGRQPGFTRSSVDDVVEAGEAED